jgi:hypothetical protein
VTVGANRRPSFPKSGSAFALQFDGGDFLRVADDAALRPEAFTIEAWVHPEALGSTYHVIAIKSTTGHGTTALGWPPRQHECTWFRQSFNQPHPSTPGSEHLATPRRHYDGHTLRLYRDGDCRNPFTWGKPSIIRSPTSPRRPIRLVRLARRTDEVRFWDRALPADELASGTPRR